MATVVVEFALPAVFVSATLWAPGVTGGEFTGLCGSAGDVVEVVGVEEQKFASPDKRLTGGVADMRFGQSATDAAALGGATDVFCPGAHVGLCR